MAVSAAALVSEAHHHHGDEQGHCCWPCTQYDVALPILLQTDMNQNSVRQVVCCCAMAATSMRPVADTGKGGTRENEDENDT